MQTPYLSTVTEAWCYTVPSDGWSYTPEPLTRTVQFCTIEAAIGAVHLHVKRLSATDRTCFAIGRNLTLAAFLNTEAFSAANPVTIATTAKAYLATCHPRVAH